LFNLEGTGLYTSICTLKTEQREEEKATERRDRGDAVAKGRKIVDLKRMPEGIWEKGNNYDFERTSLRPA